MADVEPISAASDFQGCQNAEWSDALAGVSSMLSGPLCAAFSIVQCEGEIPHSASAACGETIDSMLTKISVSARDWRTACI